MNIIPLIELDPKQADFAEKCARLFTASGPNEVLDAIDIIVKRKTATPEEKSFVAFLASPVNVDPIFAAKRISEKAVAKARDQMIANCQTNLADVQNAGLTRFIARLGEPIQGQAAQEITNKIFNE